MPGAAVVFEAIGGPPGDYAHDDDRRHRWCSRACGGGGGRRRSRPGTYTLTVDGPGKKDTIVVHAFVMVPATAVKNGMLNGYRIGAYPAKPLNGNPIYLPPPGFIEVTKENQDTKVSPHFMLKQFLCKEDTLEAVPEVRRAERAAAAQARGDSRARQRAGLQDGHASTS